MAAYRIEQVQNNNAAPHFDVPNLTKKEWHNLLVFSNSSIRVPLARSGLFDFGGVPREDIGFDPASLKLEWLKEDELLWISWTTFRLGSGGYTHDGHVILQIQGDQSRELFRDCFESIAKGGWAAQYYSSLNISYSESTRIFTFSRRSTAINGNMGVPDIRHPFPFTTTFTNDDGQVAYISKVHTIGRWHYKPAGSKLKFLRGSSAVDLGDEAQQIEEIVKGFHITRAALELMNPGIRGQHKATGVVFLDKKLEPYETSSDDGLHGYH